MTEPIDPIKLARELIRRPSVTPEDAGALDVVEQALAPLGFACERLPFEAPGEARIDNLYARLGTEAPHLCFLGHTDVVPPGPRDEWRCDPFAAEISGGRLWGRGASDMKGAIAAFIAALSRALPAGKPKGSVSLLITGDEEGPAVNGTVKVLKALDARGEVFDHCLVGEPSNPTALGDMIKIGRRGSFNAMLHVIGRQGHVAYPHLADNPAPKLLALLSALVETTFDEGYDWFQPTALQVTDLETANPAHNVIPGAARARFNIRFNPNWTGPVLEARVRAILDDAADRAGADYRLDVRVTGEAFLSAPDDFTFQLQNAVERHTGIKPELTATGGTSDARFFKDYAKIAEFGLIHDTIHKVNEFAALDDIEALCEIYADVIRNYLKIS